MIDREELASKLERRLNGRCVTIDGGLYREISMAVSALRAPAATPGWQPMDTAPDDGDFYLYGVNVTNNKTGAKWFEVWYLARDDEGQMIDASGDHFSEWSHDDFECWAKAPVSRPEQRGEG